jgi:hypothetical protein
VLRIAGRDPRYGVRHANAGQWGTVQRAWIAIASLGLLGATAPQCAITSGPAGRPAFPVPPPPPPDPPKIADEHPAAAREQRMPEVAPPATYEQKREDAPKRVAMQPSPQPAVRRVTLPDEAVVRALGTGQALFLRCFKKAATEDGLRSAKVRLHLELDAMGRVTAASTDSDSELLDACLIRVGHMLPFPAPKQPAVVDLPLFFTNS